MQRASSGPLPLICETRARARDCAPRSVSRRARAIPAQAFLCRPGLQCASWHDRSSACGSSRSQVRVGLLGAARTGGERRQGAV